MAEITFHANQNGMASSDDATLIEHAGGSGLGFFGGGFGISVPVGQYQDTTYVTNGDGTSSGVRVNNTKWVSSVSIPNSGVSANGGATIGLSGMPNYYAPLRVTFSHSEAVKVQNCKLRIFDRNDISKPASGVSTKVFECRHPQPNEAHNGQSGTLAMRGVSNFAWSEFDPAEAQFDLDFTASPGMSGLNTSAAETLPSGLADGSINWLTNQGAAHESTRHDWYIAMSASPDSIGSKTQYGLYLSLIHI